MRVITDGRRIKALLCADGRAFLSESVIFACDPHETFGRLLPSSLAPRGLLRADRVGGYPTLSSIHVAFSAKRREVPFRGTVCINGRIGCLAARAHGRMAVRAFDHEPSFARDGETVLQVMLFVTGDEADAWIALRENDPCAYEREKSALTDGARAALLAEFPSLGGSLAHLDTWTPATYRRYTGAYRGDYIGYVLEGMRMPLCLPAKIKGYENAYLASGWQSMPSGLPSAARAGERAADCLVRRLHRRK